MQKDPILDVTLFVQIPVKLERGKRGHLKALQEKKNTRKNCEKYCDSTKTSNQTILKGEVFVETSAAQENTQYCCNSQSNGDEVFLVPYMERQRKSCFLMIKIHLVHVLYISVRSDV